MLVLYRAGIRYTVLVDADSQYKGMRSANLIMHVHNYILGYICISVRLSTVSNYP